MKINLDNSIKLFMRDIQYAHLFQKSWKNHFDIQVVCEDEEGGGELEWMCWRGKSFKKIWSRLRNCLQISVLLISRQQNFYHTKIRTAKFDEL